MGTHRPTHLLKAILIAGTAVVGLGGTSIVAHAYVPPQETHTLTCSPGAVSAKHGTCTLTFTDTTKHEHSGQKVCFAVKGPGSVSPRCSLTQPTATNGVSQATSTYTANKSGCMGEGTPTEDFTTAKIVGTEIQPNDEPGRAHTVETINCPDPDGPGFVSAQGASGSAMAASARTTSATVAPLSAAQVVPVAAIVAVILLLSVAITGRLRLRRLRR